MGTSVAQIDATMGLPDSEEYPRGLLGNYDLKRLRMA